jgi:H+/Cl- antiporter ClcA
MSSLNFSLCRYWTAFGVFAGSNLLLLLFASAITSFISPAAGGSGIPEVKAYLNGVDAPNIFTLKTLFVKVDIKKKSQLNRGASTDGNRHCLST